MKSKPNSVALRSRADETVPFPDNEALVQSGGLPETLIEVGTSHLLAEPESLTAILEACEQVEEAKHD